MTLSIPARVPADITTYPYELDGEKGYMLAIGGLGIAFVTEKDAETLGRFYLFGEEPPAQPAPDPAAPEADEEAQP